MVKVKTSELKGAALDYAAAVAEGWGDFKDMSFCSREEICIWKSSELKKGKWASAGPGHGPTLLIAAMRCYVASKLGDVVDIPDELV